MKEREGGGETMSAGLLTPAGDFDRAVIMAKSHDEYRARWTRDPALYPTFGRELA